MDNNFFTAPFLKNFFFQPFFDGEHFLTFTFWRELLTRNFVATTCWQQFFWWELFWRKFFVNFFDENVFDYFKVSKFRKQIFQPKLFQKNGTNEFVFLSRYQDRKTNSMVWFLEEVLAGKFVFDFYWPLVNFFENKVFEFIW